MASEKVIDRKTTLPRTHINRLGESLHAHQYGTVLDNRMHFQENGYGDQVTQAMYGYRQTTPIQAKVNSPQKATPPSPQKQIAQVQRKETINEDVQGDSLKETIQTKLTIGSPDDPYEKEADAVADQVMRTPEPAVQQKCAHCEAKEKLLQRKEIDVSATVYEPAIVQRKCAACKAEEGYVQRKSLFPRITPHIQAKGIKGGIANEGVSTQLQASQGRGNPMQDTTRNYMESRFGAGFGNIRVHTDSQAIQLSQQLNAQAFATGNDIYFNQGKYSPESSEGKHLLAHELTHVVQQKPIGHKLQRKQEVIQRMPEEYQKQLDQEIKEWEIEQKEAKSSKNYLDAAYALRVILMIEAKQPDTFTSQEEYEDFIDDCLDKATDEDELLKEGGWNRVIMLANYEAFPHTWAKMVFEALYLEVDTRELEKSTQDAWKNVEAVGEKVPGGLMEKGLPLSFNQAMKLKQFDLSLSLVNSSADNITVDYAKTGRSFIAKKWMLGFYVLWNGIAENVRDAIENGTLQVQPITYLEFIQNKKAGIDALSAHIASASDEKTLERLNKEAIGLKDVALLMGFGSSLAGLVVALTFWKSVRQHFDIKLKEADSLIKGTDDMDRVAIALKWAYENGYFGAVGAQLWEGIKDNWKVMLATVVGFILVQYVPFLNVAVDVIVVLHSGIDALKTLAALTQAFNSARKADSVVSMQREAAKLAQSVTADGIKLILDLLAVVTGVKGVKAKAGELRTANPALSQSEAVDKAISESGLNKNVAKAVKGSSQMEEAAEITQKLGNMTPETIENLANNPSLKEALFQNRRAAWLLKKCASPCFPPNATAKQVKKLESIIKQAEEFEVKLDSNKLREFLYNQRNTLDDALEQIEEHLQRTVKKRTEEALGNSGKEVEPDMRFERPAGTKTVREGAGLPEGGMSLPKLKSDWLDKGISQIPGQIAEKMRNMTFKSWDDFRQVFWKLVAQDKELSQSPFLTAKQNPGRIAIGKAPFTRSKDAIGKGSNAKYQLDHNTPIKIGNEAFNLDELYIVTPKIHEVLGK